MRQEFQPNECSQQIICNYYPEVSLHTRINNKGTMLPQLACKATPGIYMHLKDKYSSKRELGELKQIRRMVEKQRRKFNSKN